MTMLAEDYEYVIGGDPDLDAIADELNDRPRAVLGFLTPREVFTKLLTDTIASTA
jgi:transposase, IS30 family